MRPDSNLVESITAKLGYCMKTEVLSEAFGLTVISSDPAFAIHALDANLLIQLYLLFGVILFRGFKVTMGTFENFTNRFTMNYVVNGNITRKSMSQDGTTQTVNSGEQLIPPHSEMAYTPFRPEMLWFYCETPALHGGETLVCDGLDVWSRLKRATKDLFLNRKVTYRKHFDSSHHDLDAMAMLWFGHELDRSKIGDTLANIPDTKLRVEEDGFDLEYTVPAVQKPKHHESLAFANSVIVEDRSCSFQDGEAISRDLRLELFYQAAICSLRHRWQPGDVLMLDNSRMMHGRAAFHDAQRNILVRMGREAF